MSKIKGTRFAQIPEWVLDAPISDRAVRLYGVLARIVATEKQDLPSRKTVAARMTCSVDSLDRAVKELVDIDALVVIRKRIPGSKEYGPNDYELRFDAPVGNEVAAPVPPPSRALAARSPRVCPEGGRAVAAVVKDNGSSTDRTTERSPLPPKPSTELVLLSPTLPTQAPDDPVTLIFQAWVKATSRTSATLLSPNRKRKIVKALKDYPLEDVLDAVRGWRHSPHHCGDNDQRTVYNDIDLLLRDAGKIEFFRDLERRGPVSPRGVKAPVEEAANAYLQSRRIDA